MGKRLIVVVALVAGLAVPVSADDPANRALWVWDAPSAAVLGFAADKGIDTLYLHAPPGFSSDSTYASFVAGANDAGMAVYAMAGDPSWAVDSKTFAGWAAEASGVGFFDGLVADVEPYLLADWDHPRKRNRLIRSYVSSLDSAVSAAGTAPFFAAVPFWWDEHDYRRATLVEAVIEKVTGGIVIMAYRDIAVGQDGIVDHARFEVEAAAAAGKAAVVAVETNDTGIDKVDFSGEGEAYMEGELATVTARLGPFWGFAIHDFGGYQALGS